MIGAEVLGFRSLVSVELEVMVAAARYQLNSVLFQDFVETAKHSFNKIEILTGDRQRCGRNSERRAT